MEVEELCGFAKLKLSLCIYKVLLKGYEIYLLLCSVLVIENIQSVKVESETIVSITDA